MHPNTDHDENKDGTKGQWCRVFNQAALLKGRFTLRDTKVTVDDVLTALDEGLDHQAILDRFEGLQRRDIDLCRSIAVHHMPHRPEHRKNKGGVKILLDENIGHSIIPRILNARAEFSHISFHGLTSAMDRDIYAYAENNNFSVIITNDRDFLSLTEIAVLRRLTKTGSFDQWEGETLPFIAHVSQDVLGSGQVEKIIAPRLQNVLHEAAQTPRRIAWLQMASNSLREGPDARGIYRHFMRGSAQGVMTDAPIFDEAFLDTKRLNTLCRNFGVAEFACTNDAAQEQALSALKRRKNARAP